MLTHVIKSPLASEILAIGDGPDARSKRYYFCPTYLMTNITNKYITTVNVTKHLQLRVGIAQLRQMEEDQEICIQWVEGKNELADCLIKAGSSSSKTIDELEYSSFSALEF